MDDLSIGTESRRTLIKRAAWLAAAAIVPILVAAARRLPRSYPGRTSSIRTSRTRERTAMIAFSSSRTRRGRLRGRAESWKALSARTATALRSLRSRSKA